MNDQLVEISDSKSASAHPVTPTELLAHKLHRLVTSAALTGQFDSSFIAELRSVYELASGLQPYIEACTTRPSEDLRQLALGTRQENWEQQFSDGTTEVPLEQEMLSGHVEGQFLKMLASAIEATAVLEIGMFTGYSALAIAEALPSDGYLVACELDEYAAQVARRHFDRSRHGSKIKIVTGPAAESLNRLIEDRHRFDFVFIDADKVSYLAYLHQLLDSELLAPNALICVDNTLMQGQPYASGSDSDNGRAIAAFNRAVAADPRVEQVLVPLRDGVTLIRRVDQ